ncbi:FtsW/RodA/SpoVE family cell cycle protein [Butyrivibrio sp. MC2013]|uniref:FtsW/RodA/SpoVE family cell cycle protein n=1 Tax=Butyrivibrio sp. MC2013 TaxID=1280686 RepID=UPI0004232850|nr:FtsW/RodA/SpoVE family cell cycle protein [Butyrivibrio sp. MC2013]
MIKAVFNRLKTYKYRNYDFILVVLVICLSIVGVIAVSSSDESLRSKQLMGIALGVVAMIVVSLFDYAFLSKFYWGYYALTIILLGGVILLGSGSHGAQRWLDIGGFRFQPSEISKALLILFYSKFCLLNQKKVKTLGYIASCLLLLLPPLALILLEPDLSTSIMFVIIFVCIMFVSGISWKFITAVLVITIPLGALVFYLAMMPGSPILHDYQQVRILAWLHPENYADSDAYQTMNSIMAIGSGQLQGKGFNSNEINSVLNAGFISESQTDFIFTVIGEEFGFIGSCIVLFLLLAIMVECLLIAGRARDLAGQIIATGIGCWIGFQGLMNIGVATGVLPNTGIPLPLVSAGLTSIVSVYIGIGLVLNVSLQQRNKYF